MTIDGTDISTFGLIVQRLNKYFDKPKRKKILTEQAFLANDITFNEQTPIVLLFGQYANQTTLATNVQALEALLDGDVEHDFVFVDRGISFTGVVKKGFDARVRRNDVSIVLEVGVVV